MGITSIIDAIRAEIGRAVTFNVLATTSGCSACGSLDPVTQTSTDSSCVVCEGEYWINTYSGVTITGHVTWGSADEIAWYPGGKVYEGDCRVQIKYTVANLNTVDTAKDVIVDNKILVVDKITLRGVPQINRILVDLLEQEKTDD